ncbi:hypothetical protein Tco_0530301 [Tanacetum coccineum]
MEFAAVREDDQSDFCVAENSELVSFLQETASTFSKSDLPIDFVLNSLQFYSSSTHFVTSYEALHKYSHQLIFLWNETSTADFNKALVDFPTTLFPFLSKIAAASRETLSEVTQVLSDKHIRSVILASAVPSIANEDADQVPFEHASNALAAII